MKKFKLLAVAVAAIIGMGSASAQDYNRVGISYNNNHFGFNRWLKDGAFDGLVDGISLNGTDFIAAYSHKFYGKAAKISTGNLTVTLGYMF